MMDAEKKNFITAVLRKQSGASIAPSEFAGEEMKYFPQPGDTPEVIQQKANNRATAIKGFKLNAGKSAFSANPPTTSSPSYSRDDIDEELRRRGVIK